MNPFIGLIVTVVNLINITLFIYIIISLLIAFDILNRHQPVVAKVYYALGRLFEPLLRPIRRLMPDLGGIDISPIILILLINFVENALLYYAL